jgi:hypothetical protein
MDIGVANAGGFDSHLDVMGPDPGNFDVCVDQALTGLNQANCSHGTEARGPG